MQPGMVERPTYNPTFYGDVQGAVVQGTVVLAEPMMAEAPLGYQPQMIYGGEGMELTRTSKVAPQRIVDSGLVLVRQGSPGVLRFDQWQALQAGMAAPLTCHASHPGNGIGKMYPEERRYGEWRYTESKCVAAEDACRVQLV